MKLKNVLLVYTSPAAEEYKTTLDTVKKAVEKLNINCRLAGRDRLKKHLFENRDLIIAVGGDGTFLRAAQFVKNQIMFGVNADTKNKEGFFMSADKKDFASKLRKITAGKFRIKKFPRLEARINNKKIETLALNEFFIGPRKSYHSAKYVIRLGGKNERQKSSGILVTTPAGSYAWARSCTGRNLNMNSKNFQFAAREPYEGKVFRNYKLTYGILRPGQKIIINSEMLDAHLRDTPPGPKNNHKF